MTTVAGIFVAVGAALASPSPQPSPTATIAASASAVALAWHLSANARYAAEIRMTHVVTNEIPGIYKALVGSKADPVTILEDRTIQASAGANGMLEEAISDSRRYGGAQAAKNSSVVTRSSRYSGTLSPDGTLQPDDEPLVDAGDGALSHFPDGPVQPGASWSFTRSFLIDRDLGQGTMTYTDTLERVDVRGGHAIAVIDVKASGRADVASDLRAKGYQTTAITLAGTAEFDATAGLPGVQHYVGHAQWGTHVLWVKLGLDFDDTYDAVPWAAAR
jgi:hypothetical protein